MSTTALPLARGGRTGTTLAPPRQRPQWHDPRSRALSPPMPLQTTELTGIAERRAAQSPQPPPPVPPLIQPVSATGTTTSAHAVLDRVASILDRFKESSENGNDAAMIQSQAASSLARRASIALAHAMLDHLDLTQTAATMVHETGIDLARSASTHRALRAALDRATYDRAADVLRTAASTAIPPVTPETVRPALDLCQYLGVLHAHAALGGAAALAAVEFVRAARMRAALRERIHRGPAPSVSLAPAVVADLWCAVAALAMGSAAPAGKPVPAMPYGLDPWAVAAAPAVAALAWDWDATVLAVPPPHAWMSALGAVSDARQELVVSGYYEGRLTDEPRAVIPVATLAPPRLRGGTVQEPSPDGSPTGSRASTPRASEKNSRLQQQRLGGAVELAHTHSQNQQHHGRTLRSHQQASSSTASTTTLPALPAAATRRKDSAVSLGSDAMSMTSFASSVGTGASASSLAARHAHELGSSGSAHQQQHQQLQARPTRLHHARTAVPPVLPSPGSSVTSQPWLSAKSPVRSAGGTPHDRSRGSVSQPQARSPQLPQAPSRPPPAKTGRRRVPPPPPGPRSAISPQNNHFSALEHDQQQQQSSPQRTDLPEVPVPPAVPWPRPSHAAGVDATVISPATIEDVYGPFYGVVKFMDVTMYQGSPLIAFYCDPAPDRRLIVYHAHPPNNGSTGGGRVLARIALTKPLTALSFLTPSSPTYSVHGGDSSDSPEHAQWLVGADTDADVHAWHWPTRTRRTWRKWHRRVVHMVTGFPGRRDDVGGGWGARGGIVARNNPGAVLVSCSADHSVRVWGVRSAPGELSVEDAGRWAPEDSAMASVGGRVAGAGAPASVHSNAPFLAICFSGCSTDTQLLIAAQAFTVRVYKARTLALVHTFHLDTHKMAKSPLVSLTLLADPSPPNGSPAAVAVDLPPGTSSTITADTVAAPGSYTGTSDAVVAPTSAGTNGSTILLTAMGGYVRALHLSTGTLTRAYHARELGRRVSSPVPALHSGSGTNGSLGSNSSAATAAVIASMSTSGGSYGNDLARSGNADGPGGSTASRGSGDPTGVRPAVSPCGTLVAAPGHPSERAVVVWRASSARAVPILPRGEPVPIAATMLSNGGNRASAAADTGVAGVAWCGGNDGVSPLRLVAAAVGWATAPGLGGTGGGGSAAAGLADGGIGMRARSAFCVWRVGEVRGSAGAATAASARSPGR